MMTMATVNSVSPLVDAPDAARTKDEMNPDDEIVYEVDENEVSNPLETIQPNLPLVVPQSTPVLAAQALAITSQEWSALGLGDDPNVAASSDLTVTVERVVSLVLLRIVALIAHRDDSKAAVDSGKSTYSDLSTTTICKTALQCARPWKKPISAGVISQLRTYVRRIFEQYRAVSYHNFEHAYHVTISTNKLLDLILCEESDHSGAPRPTYGLKNDPLSQLALIFSAIVHDVEHQGISNRQLVMESDELALLYNDQSVAEQRSLAIAFSELRKDEFQLLREVLFETTEDYMQFRKAVINLVLSTDIASPERTQLVKSKWKEAFGDTKESIERKERFEKSRRSVFQALAAAKQKSRSSDQSKDSTMSLPVTWNSGTKMRSPPTVIPPIPRRRKQIVVKKEASSTSLLSTNSLVSAGRSTNSVMTQYSELTLDPGIQAGGVSSRTQNDVILGDLRGMRHFDEEVSPSVTPESSAYEGLESANGRNSLSRSFETALHANLANGLIREFDEEDNDRADDEDDDISTGMALGRAVSGDSYLSKSTRTLGDTSPHRSAGISQSEHCEGGKLRGMLSRRFSSPDIYDRKRTNVRIGIRRTLDLTGEAIENYSVSHRSLVTGNTSTSPESDDDMDFDSDDPDELRATVVMEQILRAADVAPNLQGWHHMEKWSSCLFFELMESFTASRGENPQNGWYDNQITFLESYTLPLARRLNDTGSFGETVGSMFAQIVQENKERWIADGFDLSVQIVQSWEERERNEKVSR